MSRNIWIYSDPHLGHFNIINWDTGRPEFKSVSEMNEKILESHNSVVKPGDIVYCLGDVFFGDQQAFKSIWPKFHGKKRLCIGNHDNVKFLSSGAFFQKITMWRMFPEFGLLLSHCPVHKGSFKEKGEHMKNVHGHVHRNTLDDPDYINVSCEAINYTPVNIEDLRTI